jgi:predicted peptidase
MGPSMESDVIWSFTMLYPELLTAAIPNCGGGDPSMADTLKYISIWAFLEIRIQSFHSAQFHSI